MKNSSWKFVILQLSGLVCSHLLFPWLALPRAVTAQTPSLSSSSSSASVEFNQLRQTLESHDFTVILDLPPQTGTYGLLHVPSRTVWINPVVFDLGIAIPTLVHEAVHAAQLCSGSAGTLSALNLGLELYAPASRLYMRYSGTRRMLEAEAYTIQARPDRVPYVTQLLVDRC
ncbi:MAG: hypothetical protein AAF716_12315 [Cyanobacteria bacterium P01_D01_bin.1]